MKVTCEWLDAPGVTLPSLASTWCSLRLDVSQINLTRCEDRGSVCSSVYTSAFPLARWLVTNWWFLLNESAFGEVMSPRIAREAMARDWFRRHNLLHARHGQSYPDVSIYRDGPWIAYRSFPDPDAGVIGRSVSFRTDGEFRRPVESCEHEMYEFIDRTLGRLASDNTSDFESKQLETDWKAILQSIDSEADLCKRLAILGVDPYGDSNTLPESLIEDINRMADFPLELAEDTLSASTASYIANDSRLIDELIQKNGLKKESVSGPRTLPDQFSAHQIGYVRARNLRNLFGLRSEPLDLEKLVRDGLKWTSNYLQDATAAFPRKRFAALVGQDLNGHFRIICQKRNDVNDFLCEHVQSRSRWIRRDLTRLDL